MPALQQMFSLPLASQLRRERGATGYWWSGLARACLPCGVVGGSGWHRGRGLTWPWLAKMH